MDSIHRRLASRRRPAGQRHCSSRRHRRYTRRITSKPGDSAGGLVHASSCTRRLLQPTVPSQASTLVCFGTIVWASSGDTAIPGDSLRFTAMASGFGWFRTIASTKQTSSLRRLRPIVDDSVVVFSDLGDLLAPEAGRPSSAFEITRHQLRFLPRVTKGRRRRRRRRDDAINHAR